MSDKQFDALIQAAGRGDREALNKAWPDLYDHLHRIAANQMSAERSGRHLLQTTAIVHEAYFRLSDQKRSHWQDKSSFFAAAAIVMRRILIDSARSAMTTKRGGSMQRQNLSDTLLSFEEKGHAALDIHEALQRLADFAPDQSRVLELMIFGGMTSKEVATAIGVSQSTIARRIRAARAWLRRELTTVD